MEYTIINGLKVIKQKGGVMKNVNKKLIALMTLVLFALPVLVFAQLPDPTVPVPAPAGGGLTLTTFADWLNDIATFLITIGLVIAVIFIIWGGISYMAAGADEAKATAARTKIKNGFIGAVVVLGVGLILWTASTLISGQFFT